MKKFLKKPVSILVMLIFWFISWWLFKIYNKTTIIGRKNLPKRTGILILSNHQSLIDSMLIAYALFSPWDIIFHYRQIPWNAAAWENFFKQGGRRIFCYFLKTVPAYRHQGIMAANKNIEAFNQILSKDNLLLFFEGTRSRDGNIGPCVFGPAKIISLSHPITVPIKLENMDRVMPIAAGFKWYRIRGGQHITIKIGEPISFSSPELNDIRQTIQKTVVNL